MNKKKRFAIDAKRLTGIIAVLVMAVVCFLSWGGNSVAAASEIGVTIDGKSVELQSGYGEPFIDSNNRTLVPLRGVMEAFGASVSWDETARKGNVEKNGTTVQVPIGESYILVNGVTVKNDTSAVIKNERTYLPIRAVLEAFGAGVAWNAGSKTVVVRTDGTTEEFPAEPSRGNGSSRSGEMNAMWISYLEYMEMPKDEAGFKAAVDKMFDRCVDLGI
jgi:hypothetical protein